MGKRVSDLGNLPRIQVPAQNRKDDPDSVGSVDLVLFQSLADDEVFRICPGRAQV